MDLNEFNRQRMEQLVAPTVVGETGGFADRDFVRYPNGILRHYTYVPRRDGKPGFSGAYRESVDDGLNWQLYPMPDEHPGSSIVSPYSGDAMTIMCWTGHIGVNNYQPRLYSLKKSGLYFFRSTDGYDGNYSCQQIYDGPAGSTRQITPMVSRKRLLFPFMIINGRGRQQTAVMISDDDGHSWHRSQLVENTPDHVARPPHRGIRWQNPGIEPDIVELADGRIYMLLRTSLDEHYECFSEDAGETWSQPRPSPFHSTLTMPGLLRLRDGRIMAFWNNATPLPELDHTTQKGLSEDEIKGVWEDVFTNRDVLHAAISEDNAKTWIGFREIALNPHRNDADFRRVGGPEAAQDKSVHQNQAHELDNGKIIIAYGQHSVCSRIAIFDPSFLYETSRNDAFTYGLRDWTVHQYLRSPSGGSRGFGGHCAWNRRPGATLVPDPDNPLDEVLQIARHEDSRLIYQAEGATWNFPMAYDGDITLKLRVCSRGQGVQIALTDRWLNAVDPVVPDYSRYVLKLTPSTPGILPDTWQGLTLRWNQNRLQLLKDDGGLITERSVHCSACTRISYIHFQSLATRQDDYGVLLASVAMTAARG